MAQAGDQLGAARECEKEYQRDQSLVSAVEGVDFYVIAAAPEEARRFSDLVVARLDQFRARVEFFRSLALWDRGLHTDALATAPSSLLLGYDNLARFRVEWAKRIAEDSVDELLASAPSK